ncbi:hypothetical protein C8Q75DRAFT_285567 [Abortiporus biennis]|nr:hypothetical protein C8Q75DRAFT_285567 [Abortiporus biennis]
MFYSSRHIRTLCLVIVLVYKVRVQQCGVTDTSYMPMPQRCRCIRYLNLGPAVYIHRVMVSHFSGTFMVPFRSSLKNRRRRMGWVG